LVGRCTQYWPDERIRLRELLEEISQYTGRDDEDGEAEDVDATRDLTRLLRRNEHAEDNQDMALLYPDSDYPYKRKLARLALRALAGDEGDGDGDGAEGDGDGEYNGEDEDGEWNKCFSSMDTFVRGEAQSRPFNYSRSYSEVWCKGKRCVKSNIELASIRCMCNRD
jgi:hypothetical protein